jgi:POTRA domain, FtsQ-type
VKSGRVRPTGPAGGPERWWRRRGVRVLGLVLGLLVLWVGAPRLLRHVGFFRVRQIELVGVRYLAPAVVIGALRLDPHASVYDDADRLEARLRQLPGVADVRISHRLPGVLKVQVQEVEPVALVPGADGGPLTVVDAADRPLPYDPARTPVDLPVAASADSGLVRLLAMVQSLDPTMFEAVTEASVQHSAVVLDLGVRRLLLNRDAGPDVIRSVALVTQDLASRSRPYDELDARFAGQIVVRRGSRGGV